MKKREITITRYITIAMLMLVILSFIIVGSFWMTSELKEYDTEAAIEREEYISGKKSLLKGHVDNVISYIDFKKSKIELELRENIKERVYAVHAMSKNIYEENKNTKTTAEIQKMIKDAVRDIRYNNGRGYFFIGNMNGTDELFPPAPQYEGTNLWELQDAKGNFVMQDEVAVINSIGEGYVIGFWPKPEDPPNVSHEKISFVKELKELNWYIGTGEYIDDVESDIKEEVLERISKIRFDGDNYIFGGKWNGISLSGPEKGKNMYNVSDVNGVKIVQELINKSKEGGGYLHYVVPNFEGVKNAPKISYSAPVTDWEWYIGAGIYIGDIDSELVIKREKQVKDIKRNVINILSILVIFFIFIILISTNVSGLMKKQYEIFINFFDKASTKLEKIDPQKLKFTEFKTLAKSANNMVDDIIRAENAKKKAENNLKNANSRLETRVKQRTAELQKAYIELKDLDKKKDAFISIAAHELKTPLTSIQGFTQILLDSTYKLPKKKANHYLELIEKNSNRLYSLVLDLIESTKITIGKVKIEIQKIKLSQIMKEIKDNMEESIKKEGIKYEFKFKSETIFMGDFARVMQVLQNLISNAIKNTPENGKIIVSAEEKNKYIMFKIKDTGVGIPAAKQKLIFERFYQINDIFMKKISGSGLGLSICKGLVELMGGKIGVESQPSKGSTFYFSLPLVNGKE